MHRKERQRKRRDNKERRDRTMESVRWNGFYPCHMSCTPVAITAFNSLSLVFTPHICRSSFSLLRKQRTISNSRLLQVPFLSADHQLSIITLLSVRLKRPQRHLATTLRARIYHRTEEPPPLSSAESDKNFLTTPFHAITTPLDLYANPKPSETPS